MKIGLLIILRNIPSAGFEALCFCPWCPDRWFSDDDIEAHVVGHIQEVDKAIWVDDGKDHNITLTKVVAYIMMCVEHPPPYSCIYPDGSRCGTFQNPQDILDHIYQVHCPRPFKCPWRPCEGPSSVQFGYDRFKAHVRRCHLSPIWYMCCDCHMVVRNRAGLVAHAWHRRHLEIECAHHKDAQAYD